MMYDSIYISIYEYEYICVHVSVPISTKLKVYLAI